MEDQTVPVQVFYSFLVAHVEQHGSVKWLCAPLKRKEKPYYFKPQKCTLLTISQIRAVEQKKEKKKNQSSDPNEILKRHFSDEKSDTYFTVQLVILMKQITEAVYRKLSRWFMIHDSIAYKIIFSCNKLKF